jgi:predicted amidophosphoribosyltransferase
MRIEKIMTSWNETMVFATAVCSKCGKKLAGEEYFCPNCGRKLSRIRLAIPSSEVIDLINDHEKKKLQEKASQQGNEVNKETK